MELVIIDITIACGLSFKVFVFKKSSPLQLGTVLVLLRILKRRIYSLWHNKSIRLVLVGPNHYIDRISPVCKILFCYFA